jgi:hypothetical protein
VVCHTVSGCCGARLQPCDSLIRVIDEEPQFLLIARERLRPGSEDAYSRNEIQIVIACATLKCPHPYLALVSLIDPAEVVWVNAFASAEERDGVGEAYARNEPLMTTIVPLGKRKEDFRESFSTVALTRRPDLDGCEGLQLAGARYLVIGTMKDANSSRSAAIFEAPDGESFAIAAAARRAAADAAAARVEPVATVFAVQPQWSFPSETWVRSDPDFWSSSPAAQMWRRS